ncbi:type VI secretion system baseplate subunit TssG [Pollutimonas harenae]|uniref:Type VI secretion system baseplate subunit TssG n=1 Tax=Pollutimonas harenae TaxID=657015 RepID=A0A853GZE4_9BURK|nr:type VI secretion system baseplate subunit TssG [Pollutimonas harenae]NYT85130.1 type VI secretion system baseplate subunit TssG [Pollutimonas harenae]TEA72488.1 type VI secretion system baseplate subunit TssG [Pollutimonas harenae]
MAREDRSLSPSVASIEPLLAEGSRYAFFQALRLLRLYLGEEAFERSVRVRPALSLSFPEQDIDNIVRQDDVLRITANFFGLYGVTSPLPTFYTEDLIEEQLLGTSNSRDFLDILHAVLYPMLFKAWEKNRIWLAVLEQKDGTRLNQLMALLGLHRDTGATPSRDLRALLPHAGNFNQYPRSALGLQALVSGLLDGLPVSVEPCVPRTVSIPASDRSRLGVLACSLGNDVQLGSQVAECTGQALIHAGPLSASVFERLLPGKDLYKRVAQAVTHYVQSPIACVLGLRVEPAQREAAALGGGWHSLGLNTWLPEADAGAQNSPGRTADEIFLPLVDLEKHLQNQRVPS